MAVRRTNTTGCRSASRKSRVIQRGDIQRIELGIIQDIRQRNLLGNRLSGSLSSRCRRRLTDGRAVTQSLASHRLIRVNSRLLSRSLLCRSCYRLSGSLYGCLSGLCGLRLDRLAWSNRSLRYPLRLCRSTRYTGGSSGTALLIKEHATAANRLEAARTLLAVLSTMSRGRFGRTSRYGTGNTRRSRLGSLIGGLHRDVRAARACCLAVHTVYRLAGSGLTGGGASLRLGLFSSFRICALGSRVLYRLGSIIVSFFVLGVFVRLSVIALSFFCFSLSAALIAVRLDLGGKRLQ